MVLALPTGNSVVTIHNLGRFTQSKLGHHGHRIFVSVIVSDENNGELFFTARYDEKERVFTSLFSSILLGRCFLLLARKITSTTHTPSVQLFTLTVTITMKLGLKRNMIPSLSWTG